MSTYAQEVTVSDFATQLMNEFGLDENNQNEGTSLAQVLSYIDDANREFIEHRAWSFRLSFNTFNIKQDGVLLADLDILDTTLSLSDTSNYPNTGYIYIDGEIVQVLGNNTIINQLTILNNSIGRKHLTGERVYFLHKLPSDFCKVSSLFVNRKRFYPEDPNSDVYPSAGRFWIIDIIVSDDGRIEKYMMFPSGSNGIVYMRYGSLAKNLTLNPDTTFIEVPAPHRNYMKEKVFARLYKHLEEHDNAKVSDNEASRKLLKAAITDSKKHFSRKIPLRTLWDNPSQILYGNYLNGK